MYRCGGRLVWTQWWHYGTNRSGEKAADKIWERIQTLGETAKPKAEAKPNSH